MARQRVRQDEVGAPAARADQLTEAQIKALAPQVTTLEDFTSLLLSQIRIAQNGAAWTDLGPPRTVSPTTGQAVETRYDDVLSGARDGTNLAFKTTFYFNPETIQPCLNGNRIYQGADADFVILESAGAGTGYDTLILVGYAECAPIASDRLTATYVRT